jgi:cell division protein FtsB
MGMKIKADMHVPPALRRWTVRGVLALVVAGAIAYIPAGGVDGRATRLRQQLDDTRDEAATLRAGNLALAAEVAALRTDPGAIESRARDDLDMVFPGEIVIRLEAPTPAPAPRPIAAPAAAPIAAPAAPPVAGATP